MGRIKHQACLALFLSYGLLPIFGADSISSVALTNASDIHHLSRDEAGLARPVRLRGVVTYSDPGWNVLFVQDKTAGVFVALSVDAYPTNGEVVEVEGKTGDGSYLPVVTSGSWKHVGVAEMPNPYRLSSSEHFLGDMDCEWAELTGVVRQVVPDADQRHVELDLGGPGWRTRAFVRLADGFNRSKRESLIDARVRVVGVCGLDYDDTPGGLRLKTFIPNDTCLSILEPAPREPFLGPLLPLEQVRGLSATNLPLHRVRVRGVASYGYGSALVLQEGKSALQVHTASNTDFKVGDSFEAVGFLASGRFSPVLEDALVRPAPATDPLKPAVAAPATVLWGDYDRRLVELTGVFQSQRSSATNHTLVLLQDGILFGVSLGGANEQRAWNNLKRGDRLRVSGVCAMQGGPDGTPQSFAVLLRAPDDVVRLPAVHMFSGRQVLALLAIGAAAVGLVLLWGVLLRRKVSEQTRELAHSLSLLTAAIESTADGVLVVDRSGQTTVYNQVLAKMFGAPGEMIEARQDGRFIAFVAAQQKNEEEFRAQVQHLYEHPEEESFDRMELKDGRVFERYSRPQRLNGQCVGRVWCCRDITGRKEAEAKLQTAHQQLLAASRRAGRAEVATSVLHNVGNVLNSVNVSATLVNERLRRLRGDNLRQAATLIEQRMNDLNAFFTQDPKGEKLRAYLKDLGATLTRENDAIRAEVDSLRKNIEHIKTIVVMQQSYARPNGTPEWLDPKDLMEHALQITQAGYQADQIQIFKEYQSVGPIMLDRHRALQVLINLLSNARHALEATPRAERRVTLGICSTPAKLVRLQVGDNGSGIDPANINRIFNQGFTTRPDGHGFGLHSSANAAREMSGSLSVQSEGVGKGAVFTLELPLTDRQ
jgi:PAS domain S-box-containing protein